MRPFQPLSTTDQLVMHLREEIYQGRITREMPGINQLANTLGCSPRTVIGAVQQLEHEGLITKQGAGRPSLITPEKSISTPTLRVQLMMYDREDSDYDIVSRYFTQIQTHLENAGHAFSFAQKTLRQLDMDVNRVARHVQQTEADAWIVSSGSREILEWFSGQAKPAFALFGRRRGLSIAGTGPDKESAMREVTDHLIHLGHRRIILLVRPSRRLPSPGVPECAFLETLSQAGIITGDSSYYLPNWDGSIEGVHKILYQVFRLTPPTAIIVDEAQIFISVQNDLARCGILAPEHVSLVSADQDPYLDYLRPTVAHVRYETEPWARRITKWANNVAIGKDDRRQSLTKTTLVKGATIGPPAS